MKRGWRGLKDVTPAVCAEVFAELCLRGVRAAGAGQAPAGAVAVVRRPGWATCGKFGNAALLCRGPNQTPSKRARAVR